MVEQNRNPEALSFAEWALAFILPTNSAFPHSLKLVPRLTQALVSALNRVRKSPEAHSHNLQALQFGLQALLLVLQRAPELAVKSAPKWILATFPLLTHPQPQVRKAADLLITAVSFPSPPSIAFPDVAKELKGKLCNVAFCH